MHSTSIARPTAPTRPLRRLLAGVVVATAALLALSGVASAHVTVDPSSAAAGSFSVLTFRVPNERDDASTVKVTITFPADSPLAFASVQPVAGWTNEVTKVAPEQPIEVEGFEVDEVVSTVTWSGGEIEPGEFQEFKVSVGPLPEGVDQLVFDAQQTYSSGEVVDWNQPTPASGEEPEHPAPTVTLTAATGDAHGSGGADDAATSDDDHESASSSDDDSSSTLATVGVVLGAAGLVLAAAALFVALRRTTHAAS